MKTPPDPPPSIERHSRKCAICTHPNRQAIDGAFLQETLPTEVQKCFGFNQTRPFIFSNLQENQPKPMFRVETRGSE